MSEKKTVLKPLKKLTFKKTLFTWVLLWVLAAVLMFALTGFAPEKGFNGPTNINDIPRDSLKGEFVTIDDYYVLGETYEEWTEHDDGHTSDHEYYFLIWVYTEEEDGGFYTHIRVNSTDRNKLLILADDQAEYFDKIESGQSALWPHCPDYSGAVEHLDYEISSHTKSLLREIDEDEYFINQSTVELVIDPEICSGILDQEGVVNCTYIGVISIALAIITFIRSLGTAKLSKVKKFVNNTFDGDWNEAAADFETAQKYGNCYITNKCIYYMTPNRTKMLAAKLDDIVWAYKHTTITNGIAHNCMMMRTEEKPARIMTVSVSKDTAIRSALERLLNEQSHMVIGYSAQLENMIIKDMAGFKAFAATQRAPRVEQVSAVPTQVTTPAAVEEDGE